VERYPVCELIGQPRAETPSNVDVDIARSGGYIPAAVNVLINLRVGHLLSGTHDYYRSS